jgi:hypothetical protein
METYEYIAEVLSDGHLSVPDNLKDKLKDLAQVKVMLLIGEQESDWNNFTMSQFVRGYSEKDAIYDDL